MPIIQGEYSIGRVEDGAAGQVLYTWVKYSDYADGTGLYNNPKSTTLYIGLAHNRTSSTPSNNKSDYAWSKIRGENGEDGAPGQAGVGITSTSITYAASSSGTSAPSSGWGNNPPTASAGQYVWTKIVWTYSDTTTKTSYSVGKVGETGLPGPQGDPGNDASTLDIVSTTQVFKVDKNDVVSPTSAVLTLNLQNLSGNAAWSTSPVVTLTGTGNTRTLTSANMGNNDLVTVTATLGGISDSITIVKVREGKDGTPGGEGEPGKDAYSVFFTNESHTFPASTGGDITAPNYNLGKTQIRVFSGTTQLNAQDNTASSPDANNTYRVSAITTTGITIGRALVSNQIELTPSAMVGDSATVQVTIIARIGGVNTTFVKTLTYSKSKEGNQGIQGPIGPNGQPTYTWIKYADTPTTGMSDAPAGKNYIGIAHNKLTSDESSVYGDYTWSLIKGDPGSSIWTTTTAPVAPNYTFTKANLVGPTGVTQRIGDTILYSYYKYTITTVSSTTVLAGTRVSLRGSAGAPGAPGENGEDGNLFTIDLSQPEILVYPIAEPSGDFSYQYSPEQLKLKVYSQATLAAQNTYTLELHTPDIFVGSTQGQWINFATELSNTAKYGNIFTYTPATSTWSFDVDGFIKLNLEAISSVPNSIRSAQENIRQKIAFLIVLKSADGTVKLRIPVAVRSPIGDEIATFTSHAKGITAAIQNSKLDFSRDGLKITNGGFKIVKGIEDVFYADEDGNLVLKGLVYASDGLFEGELRAATGSFSGDIVATTAVLNQADIRGRVNVNGIAIVGSNSDAPGYIESANFSSGSSGFKLHASGLIETADLKLSGKAIVDAYLRLGEAWVLNPTTINAIPSDIRVDSQLINNDFIVVNKRVSGTVTNLLKINAAGRISLGQSNNIVLDAESQSIFTNNFSAGGGWSISPESAVFNNITARGSIKSSVFEYAKVQAVGGILVVRPSSVIKTAELSGDGKDVIVTVENRTGIESGGYAKVQLGGSALGTNTYLVEMSQEPVFDGGGTNPAAGEDGGQIILKNAGSAYASGLFEGTPLIFLGKQNDLGIGINSSTNGSFVQPRAISVFTTNISGSTVSLNTHILLGQIPNDSVKYGMLAGSYGLYADNVLVKGSLISEGLTAYSGISSDSLYWHESGDVHNLLNTSAKILLWAGAANATPAAVAAAPFKVYQDGSFIANNGYFVGSIITDATIKAATISTAEITGNGTKANTPALVFKDVETGIAFYKGTEARMTLGNDGLKLQMDLNIADKIKAFSSGNLVQAPYFMGYDASSPNSSVFISRLRLGFSSQATSPNGGTTPAADRGYIWYNAASEGIEICTKTSKTATFDQNLVTLHNHAKIQRNLELNNIIEHKLITDSNGNPIGYDVFVRSE